MSILQVLMWPLRRRGAAHAAALEPVDAALPALTPDQYERMVPILKVSDGGQAAMYCVPNRYAQWRAETLFTKEPDTIAWIKSFAPDATLVDVGANVGMYTIWAAKTRGVRVFAFEPESQNFSLLYRNIMLNRLDTLVTGYCAALADRDEFSLLHLGEFQFGSSCHSFAEAVDYNLREHDFGRVQGCFSTTLDGLVTRGALPVPNHIKIDVDGLEHKVLAGCRSTLEDRNVRSVLVEINTNLAEHRRIVEDMKRLGFHCSQEQIASSIRRDGPFKGVGNHVFRR